MSEADKQIIEKLLHEERIEDELIKIYSALLDMNVTVCFPQFASEKFGQYVKKLQEDSKKHFLALEDILKKYE